MKSTTRISRTTAEMALLAKYWAALLLLVSAVVIGGRNLFVHPARIPFVATLVIAGLFCLTAAEVRAEAKILRYRRFLVWKQIPYDEICECRSSLLPGFGYIGLAYFLAPFGRLYFVIARPAFTGNPEELVANINARRAGTVVSERQTDDGASGDNATNWAIRLCTLTAFIGVIYGFLLPIYFPRQIGPASWEGFPPWVALLMGLYQRAMTWPWAVGTMMVFMLIILQKHFENRAWILAWACGVLLGSMLTKLLS
jgi:hypothetical protein